jgi:hypothetical protein
MGVTVPDAVELPSNVRFSRLCAWFPRFRSTRRITGRIGHLNIGIRNSSDSEKNRMTRCERFSRKLWPLVTQFLRVVGATGCLVAFL